MKLNMEILCDALAHFSPDSQILPRAELDLTGPRLWDGDVSCLRPEYVYVTTAECLISCEELSAPTNIICVGYNPYLFHRFINRASIIAVDKDVPLLTLFDAVSEIFDRFSDHERDLLLAIADGKPIEDILRAAVPFFNNPLILLDESLMRIAVIGEVDGKHIDPENWKSILEDGHVEADVLKVIRHRAQNSGIPVHKETASFSSVHPMRYSAISAPIWYQEKPIGSLVIPEEFCKMSHGLLGVADLVAEYIAGPMQRTGAQGKKDYASLEQFFKNLLSGASVSREFMAFQLEQLHWKPDDQFIVCAVELNENELFGPFYNYGAKQIKSILGDCFYLIYGSAQIFITNTSRISLSDEILSHLRSTLIKRETHAGFSMPSTGLSTISSQYVLAVEALRLGKRKNAAEYLFFYQNYVEAHIVDMELRPANMLAICLPKVLELYQHDLENGTDYVNTLYVYLCNERSPLKAAKQLFIHRNSLMYRIEKINSLLDYDLEDPRLRAHLIISCRIIRYHCLDQFD